MSPRNINDEDIMEEIIDLRYTVEQLRDYVVQLSATVKNFIKNEGSNNCVIKKEKEVTFPIRTIIELEELDALVEEDPLKYRDMFQKMISSTGGGLEKGLKKIISPAVALEYNFNGTYNKRSFKSLTNINTCLYDAVKSDVLSSEHYRKACQQGLKKIKNLHFKKVSEKKLRQIAQKEKV